MGGSKMPSRFVPAPRLQTAALRAMASQTVLLLLAALQPASARHDLVSSGASIW